MLYKKYGAKNKVKLKICKNCGQQLPRKSQTPLVFRKIQQYILVLAIVCVIAGALGCSNGRESHIGIATGLPREIERIVFEEWDGRFIKRVFAEPIVEIISEDWVNDASLRNFLVKNHYAEVKTITEKILSGTIETKYLYYNDSIKPYIGNGEFGALKSPYLILARRKLRRIDFKNEYEELGEKFYAIKFTYALEEELPGLPDIEREFKGKAELYWDPSEGAWTLQYTNLEDSYLDYMNVLSEIYGE